jgi:predicted solute-binding protein
VFARWIVRRDAAPAIRTRLEKVLETCFEANMQNIGHVAQIAADRVGLPVSLVERYLRAFDYRLDDEAEKAIALFREMTQAKVQTSGSLS